VFFLFQGRRNRRTSNQNGKPAGKPLPPPAIAGKFPEKDPLTSSLGVYIVFT
jgi:hypothetical protein